MTLMICALIVGDILFFILSLLLAAVTVLITAFCAYCGNFVVFFVVPTALLSGSVVYFLVKATKEYSTINALYSAQL